MATKEQVESVISKAWDEAFRASGVHPVGMGITMFEGSLALEVSFPKHVSQDLPTTLLGVPVVYSYASPTQFLSRRDRWKKLRGNDLG